MQCDHKPWIQPSRVDFVSTLEPALSASFARFLFPLVTPDQVVGFVRNSVLMGDYTQYKKAPSLR
jgi:hypothetical protein